MEDLERLLMDASDREAAAITREANVATREAAVAIREAAVADRDELLAREQNARLEVGKLRLQVETLTREDNELRLRVETMAREYKDLKLRQLDATQQVAKLSGECNELAAQEQQARRQVGQLLAQQQDLTDQSNELLAREKTIKSHVDELVVREQNVKRREEICQLNMLIPFLKECHLQFSEASHVDLNATGPIAGHNLEDRIIPYQVRHWKEFPQMQAKVWEAITKDPAVQSTHIFPSDNQLQYVSATITPTMIDTIHSLSTFQLHAVDNFVGVILHVIALHKDLRQEFGLDGRITVQDRPDPGKESQFCVYAVAGERRRPIYTVDFKAPCSLPPSVLREGLHDMEIERDVIKNPGDKSDFKFHATQLVAAALAQQFSYMLNTGVRKGVIRTGQEIIFLNIPDDSPPVLEYYLCRPKKDAERDREVLGGLTAVGQLVAWAINAHQSDPLSQSYYDNIAKERRQWKFDYGEILRTYPGPIWSAPPSCQPDPDQQHVADICQSVKCQSAQHSRFYCTVACIHGLLSQGELDPKCPNVQKHGVGKHPIDKGELARRLMSQFHRNYKDGFEQLHIRGRVGSMMRAVETTYGYTVIMKAASSEQGQGFHDDVNRYEELVAFQGDCIPILIGKFKVAMEYRYQGQIMVHMMILSWCGVRIHRLMATEEQQAFFRRRREKFLESMNSKGLQHRESGWHNVLWLQDRFFVIDLEDLSGLVPPQESAETAPHVQ